MRSDAGNGRDPRERPRWQDTGMKNAAGKDIINILGGVKWGWQIHSLPRPPLCDQRRPGSAQTRLRQAKARANAAVHEPPRDSDVPPGPRSRAR